MSIPTIIPLIFPSALEFWLLPQNRVWINHLLNNKKYYPLPDSFETCNDKRLIQAFVSRHHLQYPVTAFAQSDRARRNNAFISYRVRNKSLPKKSFYLLDQYEDSSGSDPCFLLVASPELCFLQAGAYFSLYQMILLGFQLCAQFLPNSLEEYGQMKVQPLTTVKELRSYLSQATRVDGLTMARRASRYIVGGSNSPMETMIAMMGSLPNSIGGCGLPIPIMNMNIQLTKEGADVFGKSTCCCDLVWPEQKVAVEYDSNLTHLSVDQHEQDKKKATALTMSGYHLINITARQVQNVWRLDEMFNNIRIALHLRTRKDRLEAAAYKRQELFDFLRKQSCVSAENFAEFIGRDPRDPRDMCDTRCVQDMQDMRDTRDMRDPRDPRDMCDTRCVQDMQDMRDTRDMRDPRDMSVSEQKTMVASGRITGLSRFSG